MLAPIGSKEESSSCSSSSSNSSSDSHDRSTNSTPWNNHPISAPSDMKDSTNSAFSSVDATEEATEEAATSTNNNMVTAEQERQILLLMLLAQVCALHDPTPKTFTVHVLELYERGLLERQSIAFLFDLGLVPEHSPTYLLVEPGQLMCNDEVDMQQDVGIEWTVSPRLSQVDLRAQETSAIRSRLEQHEENQYHSPLAQTQSKKRSSSWAIDQHPLSLSRYQREFKQGRLLNSGSFGSVYCATNVFDGRDYAIKRVMFSASGYRNDSIHQVVREVRCLAQCDHPNVVRYYTSWLEPSWVTGSGHAVNNADQISSKQTQRKLLTDIHQMLTQGQSKEEINREGSSFESWGSRSNYTDNSEIGGDRFSHNNDYRQQSWQPPHKQQPKQKQQQSYRYQMGFYIQMQLCSPSTLADWIRTRNSSYNTSNRYQSAIEIFGQLVQGIQHIHEKGIIHRDLKPANIFCGEDGLFKIGDFGLSKLLTTANCGHDFYPVPPLLLPSPQASVATAPKWQDPNTAGLGTASYCAPEQESTQYYGPKADIFSLGLILLELVCSFGTEHERISTFRDCRRGTLPKSLNDNYITSIILACTNKDPSKRPTAESLVALTLDGTEELRHRLDDSKHKLEQYKLIIAEKDRIIEELTRKVESMNNVELLMERAAESQNVHSVNVGIVESVESTTFDDDDY